MEKDKEFETENQTQPEPQEAAKTETDANPQSATPLEENVDIPQETEADITKNTPPDKEKAIGLERLKKRRRFKRIRFFAILTVLLALIIAVIISTFSKSGKVIITIPKGSSSARIAEILKENDVIESKYLFLFNLKCSEYNGKLHYGTFTVDKADSYKDIIEVLATNGAKKATVTITIPEGYSVEQIKATVVNMGLSSDSEFEEALKKDYDFPFLKTLHNSSDVKYRLQGYLYPSTYEVYADASAEDIITTMLNEFEKQTKDLSISDYNEIITLASLIERESKLDSERKLISGVMKNRTDIGMPLQIDATVVYAISDGMYDIDRVFYKDLEIDSPYNTYKYSGLPAGPICSPGIKSINAAINPAKHSFLYYHTDTEKNDGSHIFTETYEEHTNTMK